MQNNDSPVVWEDPPSEGIPRRRLTGTHPLVVTLKANPNRWARIAEYPRGKTAFMQASRLRTGQFAWARPAGSFDAEVRHIGGQCVVYARYVGQPNGGAR